MDNPGPEKFKWIKKTLLGSDDLTGLNKVRMESSQGENLDSFGL
jgi:hypothetical protein